MKKLATLAFVCLVSSLALGAGQLPKALTAQEAQAAYAPYKTVIESGIVSHCPGPVLPTSGVLSGGAAPVGGSQTLVFKFDNGASVTVYTTWMAPVAKGPGYKNNSITIKCQLP